MPKLIIIVGGGSEADQKGLSRCAERTGKGSTITWSCPKQTRTGDRLLIYNQQPQSAIIAAAVAVTDATKAKNWPYMARIGRVKMFDPPVHLSEIRRLCPTWRWAKHPQSSVYVGAVYSRSIEPLLEGTGLPGSDCEIRVSGGGFGTAEQNKKVEEAACSAVKRYYQELGFRMKSRELECLGYDFDACKGKRSIHVEVKGVSGADEAFIITEREQKLAASDPAYELAVVTNALSRKRKIHCYKGRDVTKHFALIPIAYRAALK
jgi:hypothetical protein